MPALHLSAIYRGWRDRNARALRAVAEAVVAAEDALEALRSAEDVVNATLADRGPLPTASLPIEDDGGFLDNLDAILDDLQGGAYNLRTAVGTLSSLVPGDLIAEARDAADEDEDGVDLADEPCLVAARPLAR